MHVVDVCTAGILDGESTEAGGQREEARHGRQGDC